MPQSQFFERPILKTSHGHHMHHWELDGNGQPTKRVLDTRRLADFVTPIPKPKKQKGATKQESPLFDETPSTQDQQYRSTVSNGVRAEVDPFPKSPAVVPL